MFVTVMFRRQESKIHAKLPTNDEYRFLTQQDRFRSWTFALIFFILAFFTFNKI